MRRPVGEAPEWVRDAWIGLLLPLASEQRRVWRGVGVITGPRSRLAQFWAMLRGRGVRIDGYLVEAGAAVDRLERHRPDAAAWWRTHAPGAVAGWFVFDAAACEQEG